MKGRRGTSGLVRIIETYGASPRRWPRAEGAGTPELSSAERTALQREAALDRLLDRDGAEPPLPATLRARILAAAPAAGAAGRVLPFPIFAPWMRAAGVAAVLAGGMAAGYAGAAAAFPMPAPEQTLLGLALTAPENPFAAFLENDA